MNSKEEIRKSLITVLRLLTPSEVREKSIYIVEKILATPQYKMSKDVFSYVPDGKWEVDVTLLIHKAFADGKRVWVPRIDGENLVWHNIDEKKMSKLVKNIWEIPEPLPFWEPLVVQADSDAVCIVPGIAFDRFGNRIGRGKGFFDRFLKKSRCYAIGVCFTFQIVQRCPWKVWDVRMNKVITEDYEFTILNPGG
ncbi:MAG: 5-formyltetrahydrofolate cyclo-ligase [Candidatus Hydrogenedentes bacterium]|nr:5-formyltetrahydrofolate cyclo-ligase [Candidatus Hydrogenedentota bacterium]